MQITRFKSLVFFFLKCIILRHAYFICMISSTSSFTLRLHSNVRKYFSFNYHLTLNYYLFLSFVGRCLQNSVHSVQSCAKDNLYIFHFAFSVCFMHLVYVHLEYLYKHISRIGYNASLIY